jgi:hypothetical protein
MKNELNNNQKFNKMKQLKFSFFKAPITNVNPYKDVSIEDVYKLLTGPYLRGKTLKLRNIYNKEQNREFKTQQLPYVTFSGKFSTRNEKALIKYSGLIVIDFDRISDIEKLQHQLLRDKYFETELLFTSPNGNGLKWIIPVNINGEYNHAQWFEAISRYIKGTYKIEVDKSGRDISRACFLTFDPNTFMHPRHGRMNRQH